MSAAVDWDRMFIPNDWIKPAGITIERAAQIAVAVVEGKSIAAQADPPPATTDSGWASVRVPLERQKAALSMLRSGMTVEDVGEELAMSRKTVRKLRNLANIPAIRAGRYHGRE